MTINPIFSNLNNINNKDYIDLIEKSKGLDSRNENKRSKSKEISKTLIEKPNSNKLSVSFNFNSNTKKLNYNDKDYKNYNINSNSVKNTKEMSVEKLRNNSSLRNYERDCKTSKREEVNSYNNMQKLKEIPKQEESIKVKNLNKIRNKFIEENSQKDDINNNIGITNLKNTSKFNIKLKGNPIKSYLTKKTEEVNNNSDKEVGFKIYASTLNNFQNTYDNDLSFKSNQANNEKVLDYRRRSLNENNPLQVIDSLTENTELEHLNNYTKYKLKNIIEILDEIIKYPTNNKQTFSIVNSIIQSKLRKFCSEDNLTQTKLENGIIDNQNSSSFTSFPSNPNNTLIATTNINNAKDNSIISDFKSKHNDNFDKKLINLENKLEVISNENDQLKNLLSEKLKEYSTFYKIINTIQTEVNNLKSIGNPISNKQAISIKDTNEEDYSSTGTKNNSINVSILTNNYHDLYNEDVINKFKRVDNIKNVNEQLLESITNSLADISIPLKQSKNKSKKPFSVSYNTNTGETIPRLINLDNLPKQSFNEEILNMYKYFSPSWREDCDLINLKV